MDDFDTAKQKLAESGLAWVLAAVSRSYDTVVERGAPTDLVLVFFVRDNDAEMKAHVRQDFYDYLHGLSEPGMQELSSYIDAPAIPGRVHVMIAAEDSEFGDCFVLQYPLHNAALN